MNAPGRQYIATFGREGDVLGATAAVRSHGLEVVDVYTPYAVHGLDRAMGLKQSRLTWACFAFGMAGALGALWFQYWTSAIDWDLNVGGKPFNSLPAFTPVLFELMVLLGGLGVVGTFLWVSRLYPGKRARPIVPGVTNDRFALVCEDRSAFLKESRIHEILSQFNALAIEERVGQQEVRSWA